MKYYIEYPIPIRCGMRCPYCFHTPLWEFNARYPDRRYGDKCAFTFGQYKAWRDRYLSDGTEFLMELHGGELSYKANQRAVLDLIDAADKERFQLQTNGMGNLAFFDELIARKSKIDRIGFTYHRRVLDGAFPNSLIEPTAGVPYRFANAVSHVNDNGGGIKVYVKELLFIDDKPATMKHKRYWEDRGVEFRIQDFKGDGGLYNTESAKYTAEDWALIHPEYRHTGKCCHCRDGYKQLIIRGYDQWGGDVLACWQDHRVIGSITEDWYEPYEHVRIDDNAARGRTVVGKGVYRSDYLRDVKLNALEKHFHTINPRRSFMIANFTEKADTINATRQNIAAEAGQLRQLIENCERRLNELTTEDVRLAAKAELLQELIAAQTPEPAAVEAVEDVAKEVV